MGNSTRRLAYPVSTSGLSRSVAPPSYPRGMTTHHDYDHHEPTAAENEHRSDDGPPQRRRGQSHLSALERTANIGGVARVANLGALIRMTNNGILGRVRKLTTFPKLGSSIFDRITGNAFERFVEPLSSLPRAIESTPMAKMDAVARALPKADALEGLNARLFRSSSAVPPRVVVLLLGPSPPSSAAV